MPFSCEGQRSWDRGALSGVFSLGGLEFQLFGLDAQARLGSEAHGALGLHHLGSGMTKNQFFVTPPIDNLRLTGMCLAASGILKRNWGGGCRLSKFFNQLSCNVMWYIGLPPQPLWNLDRRFMIACLRKRSSWKGPRHLLDALGT